MKLSNLKKFAIIRVIGLLLILLAIGCEKKVVNNETENPFDGIWEMEYNSSIMPSVSYGFDIEPIPITIKSILTIKVDSFNVQIKTGPSYQNLNREYAGDYSISADTIRFNVIYSSPYKKIDIGNLTIFGEEEKLHFKFINSDSLKFRVIGEAISDSLFSIPMTSFLWHTGDLWPPMRASGTYTRIDM